MWSQLRATVEREDFKNSLSSWWRPILGRLHHHVRTAIEYHRVQRLLVENKELKSIGAQSDRCFIIGNGPSIKNQDLTRLMGETKFVVNSFFLHPEYDLIDPTFHCGADKNIGTDAPNAVAYLKNLDRVAKRARIMLPTDAEPIIRKYQLFKGRHIFYLFFSVPGCDQGKIRMDLTRPMSSVSSVSVACILAALYMGFRTIYLLGCDHDWLATTTTYTHFYEKDPYWSYDATVDPYEINMENQLRLWRSYRHIREFALKRGTRIYNATRGGFLDVFPRVEYESLVDLKPGKPGS
jgi:hypothetical protein